MSKPDIHPLDSPLIPSIYRPLPLLPECDGSSHSTTIPQKSAIDGSDGLVYKHEERNFTPAERGTDIDTNKIAQGYVVEPDQKTDPIIFATAKVFRYLYQNQVSSKSSNHQSNTGDTIDQKAEYYSTGPLTDPYTLSLDAYIFTVEFGDANPSNIVVCTAGYGWASPAYISFYERFLQSAPSGIRFILLDWLGTGGSTRVQFPPDVDREWNVKFFSQSLHAWFLMRGYIGLDIELYGHSIGGYLASMYVALHPGVVRKLILLSPCGMGEPPDQYCTPEMYAAAWDRVKREEDISWLNRIVATISTRMWQAGMTPNKIVNCLGPFICKPLISKFIAVRGGPRVASDPSLQQLLTEWMVASYNTIASGDTVIHHLFLNGHHAAYCLKYLLNRVEVEEISIVYGSRDWMNPLHGVNYVNSIQRGLRTEEKQHLAKFTLQPDREVGPRLISERYYTYDLHNTIPVPNFIEKNVSLFIIYGAGHQVTLEGGNSIYDVFILRHQSKYIDVLHQYTQSQ